MTAGAALPPRFGHPTKLSPGRLKVIPDSPVFGFKFSCGTEFKGFSGTWQAIKYCIQLQHLIAPPTLGVPGEKPDCQTTGSIEHY